MQQLDVPVSPTAAAGEAAFAIDFTATTSDTHELALQAVDADGQVSSFVTRTFPVTRAANAPVITNLTVGVPRLYVDISTVIPVTIAFTDADRNVARVHARVFSPSGSLDAEHVLPATGAGGLHDGSFALDIPFTPASTGRYRLDVRLEDGDGLRSADTSRTIDALVPSSTAPNIFDVAIDAASTVAGRPATVTGTASFTDIDANVTALVMRIRGANNTTIASGEINVVTLPNRAANTVSFGLDWTPPAVGFYTIDILVRDADAQDSRVLSFGLNATLSPTAPVLSNLSLGSSRGILDVASTVAGTVNFSDSNGNIVSLVVEITDASGRVVTTMTDDVTEVGNATSGTLPFSVGFTPVTTGRYTATTWAIDGAGELSNRVSRTFDVIRTSTTPSISDLRLTLGTVFPRAEATASGSLRFADVDANVTRLLVRIQRPDGTTLVDRQFAQTGLGASGIISFELPFSADVPGRHTLEAWVEDAAGQGSTREARTFDVTDTRPAATRFVALYDSLFPTKASTVTAVIDFRDLDANLTSLQLRLLRPDGSVFWTTDEALAGVEDLVSGQLSRAVAFTPDVPGRHTLEGWLVDAEGQSSTRFSTHVDVGDLANVYSACAALNVDCSGEGLCYDIKDNTCEYFEERLLTPPDACETIATTNTVAQCVSSTTDPESPLLTETNRCSMVQYWSWPTAFPIDCRCPEAALDNRCRRPYEIPQNVTFGSGPRIRGLASTMRAWNGLIEGREFFVPIMWSTAQRPNETMIFAVNLDTGARRHFSGAWEGPNGYAEVGSGEKFVQVMDIKKGADGQFYAVGATSDIAAPKIWRINPANGNRRKIFDADTVPEASLCPNFSTLPGRKVVQLTPEGWAMDSQGRFYFSNIGMPGPSVLRITIDGRNASCEYVTRVMDCPTCSTQEDVGGGYGSIQFDMRAFEIVGDKLYTVSDNRFLEIDIPTGNRRLMSLGSDIGAYGTGPINAEAFGDRWTRWDPYRGVFWTVGVLGGSWAVTVAPETGNRNAWPCFHDTRGVLSFCGGTGMGLTRGPLNFGGFAIDPQSPHDLYFAHDIFAIVKYDARTGNAYNFSL